MWYRFPMAGIPATTSRFAKRRQRNREALIEAALELFQRQGLRGTKLEDVCARADVAPRTFFNHFETREHLYQAIAEQRASQLAARLDAAHDSGPFAQQLERTFSGAARHLAKRPLYRELVAEMLRLRPETGSEIARERTLGQAALRFIENGIARGEVTRAHAPEVLADVVIGTLVTALTNWCADERYDLEAGLAAAGDALLDLFAPRTKRSTTHRSR
jgi:AcrR family transcriptional regulator